MRDKVFIAWSGSKEVALKVKNILDNDNYICIIGGNADNDSQNVSVGDTVIQQIKTCNQAIVIFQNKNESGISGNLFFELGYVFAKYGAKKVHCVKRRNDEVILPSDFDNAFVEPIDCESEDELAKGIVSYFLGRQKMSIDINKMRLINNRYRIHDMIQAHYSPSGSRCSDYELAQYLLFYMQAANMFGDCDRAYQEINDFNRDYYDEFSEELRIAVKICLAFFKMVNEILKNEGGTYISFKTYKDFIEIYNPIKEGLSKKCEGVFDAWVRVFVTEQMAYAHMLYAGNESNKPQIRARLYEMSIDIAQEALEAIEVLEKTTPAVENNDKIGLILLIRSYIYRNIFVSKKNRGEDFEEWLKSAKDARRELLNNFSQGVIDSKLYENFEMEYYLILSEYLLEFGSQIDDFERMIIMSQLEEYLEKVRENDRENLYIRQINEYYMMLAGQE